MEHSLSVLFWLNRSKRNRKGHMPVYCRITVDGRRAEISTGKWIESDRWNQNSARVRGINEETKTINNYLDNLRFKITKTFDKLDEGEGVVSSSEIKNLLLGKKKPKISLIDTIDYLIKRVVELEGIEYKTSTIKRYYVTRNHVIDFLKSKRIRDDIALIDLKYSFLTDFEHFLRTEYGCGNNAAIKHITYLKKAIRLALDNDWLEKDPFSRFKGKRIQEQRLSLSEVELNQIEDKQITNERLSQIRDIFVFCCYTGLSYADVSTLSRSNIIKDIKGKEWVSIQRQKTGNPSRIPLLPKACEILNKYKDNPLAQNKGVLLPVISNQKTNAYLKEIAVLADIIKPLTFHIARHTFATSVTLNNDIPIETVSKMLGHQSLKTTQIYAKVMDEKVGRDMQKLSQKILGP